MQEATHSALTSSINHLSEEAVVHLPKIDSLKRANVRSRKKYHNVPPEPTSLTNLEIPEFYTITDWGDRFLLYDSEIESENQRMLIFGTERNLEILSTSSVCLADGTKTVPGLSYQLYVIHALKGGQDLFRNGHLLPSLFVLLPNKSEESFKYNRMWTKV